MVDGLHWSPGGVQLEYVGECKVLALRRRFVILCHWIFSGHVKVYNYSRYITSCLEKKKKLHAHRIMQTTVQQTPIMDKKSPLQKNGRLKKCPENVQMLREASGQISVKSHELL
jgi:hypothetical protein